MKKNKFLLNQDLGLLILRIFAGLMMFSFHGLQKVLSWDRLFNSFSDPLGIGSEASYLLTIIAEALCSILIILGLFTRYAAIPLVITMLVAAFIVHGADPWTKKEMALLYGATFLTLFFTGPGTYSVDAIIKNK